MNYYIFGDSFCEDNGNIDWLWYHRIDGTVINDCLGCTGVKKNLQQLKLAKPIDTNIIFLLTNKHRLIWPFVKQRNYNEYCYQVIYSCTYA